MGISEQSVAVSRQLVKKSLENKSFLEQVRALVRSTYNRKDSNGEHRPESQLVELGVEFFEGFLDQVAGVVGDELHALVNEAIETGYRYHSLGGHMPDDLRLQLANEVLGGINTRRHQEDDGSVESTPEGLYQKFWVRRTDGTDQPGGKHFGCRYFVLDVDHDKFAGPALAVYADACEKELPELAKDLREQFGALHDSPQGPSEKPTTMRQQFEETFPVPENVRWNPNWCGDGRYEPVNALLNPDAGERAFMQHQRWIGWKSRPVVKGPTGHAEDEVGEIVSVDGKHYISMEDETLNTLPVGAKLYTRLENPSSDTVKEPK
jgi:hypothetical protein